MSERKRAPLSVHNHTSAHAHRLENIIRDFRFTALGSVFPPSISFGYFHLFCACVVLFSYLDYFLRFTDRLESLYICYSLYIFI